VGKQSLDRNAGSVGNSVTLVGVRLADGSPCVHNRTDVSLCLSISPPLPASFIVLVAGTLVYGRGDDEEAREEFEELRLPAGPPPAAGAAPPGPTAPVTSPAPRTTRPIHMVGTPASLKVRSGLVGAF
jgi:hypothetical protein